MIKIKRFFSNSLKWKVSLLTIVFLRFTINFDKYWVSNWNIEQQSLIDYGILKCGKF